MTEAANNFQTGNEMVLLLRRSDDTELTYETVQGIQVAGVAISAFWLAHHNAESPEHHSKKGRLCNAR